MPFDEGAHEGGGARGGGSGDRAGVGIYVIHAGFAREVDGDGGAGIAGGGDGGKFGVGGGGGAGFGEELVERERFPGGGSDAADVALGPGDDFLFEGEGDAAKLVFEFLPPERGELPPANQEPVLAE